MKLTPVRSLFATLLAVPLGLWAQTGRPLEEFWELSPAQTAIMFEARGWMKKRAGAEQLMAFASQMGMSVQKK